MCLCIIFLKDIHFTKYYGRWKGSELLSRIKWGKIRNEDLEDVIRASIMGKRKRRKIT